MIKEAFERGFKEGLKKEAFDVTRLGWPALILAGAVPVLGGAATGYLHGSMDNKDYGKKTEQLLAQRELDIREARNKKLREDIQRMLKAKNLSPEDIGYKL
jgi:hypothetical protein